ncbi:hypothetical protein [Nitrosospira multiformis]|uniref:hypothetical protein n=1 Tax=Nitrosospira multiformis TaxID=1231 RepID=UPI000942A810|nr:hypothetical protein [Nitrosospira multiformis]
MGRIKNLVSGGNRRSIRIPSTRHEAGVALRFPRMLQILDDKKTSEADILNTLTVMLGHRWS